LETFYSILGVDETATIEEIKKAYKSMAVKYHPDKVTNMGDKIKFVAEMESKKINEAKEILLNSKLKDEYDEVLKKGIIKPQKGIIRKNELREDIVNVEEFDKEVKIYKDIINNLNYEISLLKGSLEWEKNRRTTLDRELKLSAVDKDWMVETLEALVNSYDQQFRTMDDAYRNIVNKAVHDLNMEIQFSEDEMWDVQNRINQVQWLSKQCFDSVFGPYNNFSEIRNRIDSIKRQGYAEAEELVEEPKEIVFTPVESDISQRDGGWEVYTPPPDQNNDIEFTPITPDEYVPVSEIDEPVNEPFVAKGPAGPLSKECPFCGKDIDGEQTYCYYCGAVF
jgi:curved DNA-binding protein CbpA